MVENSKSRKWQVTINNPLDKGYTHEKVKEVMKEYKNCIYWCMADEKGAEGTYHTHIFLHCSSAVRFSTMLKRFSGGHFEMCKGTSEQNRDYVFKQGKWRNTEKGTTNYEDSHYEQGDLPVERQGKRNDLDDLYDMVKSGMSDYEIVEDNPSYMLRFNEIERCRQIIREKEYSGKERNVSVAYMYGKAGSGKTSFVYKQHGYADVYRITDYLHPWDGYAGQPIVVFEEFRSSVTMRNMLNWLDIYPITDLPSRYRNKVACYEMVYIISNIRLCEQYPEIQKEEPETWNAFLRRIKDVIQFMDRDKVKFLSVYEELHGFHPVGKEEQMSLPFNGQ